MQTQENTKKLSGRGVPSKGYRMTLGRRMALEEAKRNGIEIDLSAFTQTKSDFVSHLLKHKSEKELLNPIVSAEETFEEIYIRTENRFKLLEEMAIATAIGENSSLIVSGSAGIAKTTTVINVLESLGVEYSHKKGSVTPVSFYRMLYENKAHGTVLVLDDISGILEEKCIEILKSATDSQPKRLVGWHSSRKVLDEDGEEIPNEFIFEGSIIYISNIDFYAEANGNNAMAEHLKAMISRSFVLDLALRTTTEMLCRVKSVLFNDMKQIELNTKHKIYNFLTDNAKSLREISLRSVNKLQIIINMYGSDWQEKGKLLLCKGY